jgi:hypothetical protein
MKTVTGPRPAPLVLRAAEDLDEGQISVLRRHGARGGNIGVALSAVPPPRAVRSELTLNSSARDCGCETGSRVATLALLVLLAAGYLRSGSVLPQGVAGYGLVGAVVLAAALVGKALGILLARRRLAVELGWLRTQVGGA